MLARLLERSWRRPRVWLAVGAVLVIGSAAFDQSRSPAFFVGMAGMAALCWAALGLADEAVR